MISYDIVFDHFLCFESKSIKWSAVFLLKFDCYRHANVFANLLSMMLDANIPDIALERDKAVKKVWSEERKNKKQSLNWNCTFV